MSKSLGNIIDPLDLVNGCTLDHLIDMVKAYNCGPTEEKKSIEEKKKDYPSGIGECGSDALRFGLLAYMI